jgi:hypothetical protein
MISVFTTIILSQRVGVNGVSVIMQVFYVHEEGAILSGFGAIEINIMIHWCER